MDLRRRSAWALVWMLAGVSAAVGQAVPTFEPVTVEPAFELEGRGTNVDSIAVWEAPEPTNTLMFVTAKGNDLVEVWRHPFEGNELAPIEFSSNVNGVAVDQETDRLYVSDRKVSVFSVPELELVEEFGEGIIGPGENNLDILKHDDGRTLIYVSENHRVHRFDADTLEHLGSFAPPVTSIETVLADDFHQVILVPEEQGAMGSTGVYAYHPDGTAFQRDGTNRFGNDGVFDADEEGILLYTFPTDGTEDNGAGFYVVSDQRSDRTDFEFFDRETWVHLGTVQIEGVANTDGIASTQTAMPGYPMGFFAAINFDTTTVAVGWDTLFEAMGVTPYRLWSLDHGLEPGVNGDYTDDPDNDGALNMREFAVAGDPLDETVDGARRLRTMEMDGETYFTYTFPVRNGADFNENGELSAAVDGIIYSVEGAFELVDFQVSVVEEMSALEEGLPVLDPGWRYRTFRLNSAVSAEDTGFIRLRIGEAP